MTGAFLYLWRGKGALARSPISYLANLQLGLIFALVFATDFLFGDEKHRVNTGDRIMKFSLSNFLAIASILVWATAWAATEKKADAEMPTSSVSISQAAPSAPAALAR
jgi:hypothetical protein